MPAILLAMDHAGFGLQLTAALEAAGHTVSWVAARDAAPPAGQKVTPDVVLLDADAGSARVEALVEAWRALDPPPALLALAERPGPAAPGLLAVLAKRLDPPALAAAMTEAARRRFTSALTIGCALRIVGLPAGGDPERDAQVVVNGARKVDLAVVQEAMAPYADAYVSGTALLARLREARALPAKEMAFAELLDGARTVRSLARAGGLEPPAVGRLLWALASARAVTLEGVPPDDRAHPAARAVAWARRCLVGRHDRLRKAGHYELLDVGTDAEVAEVEEAARGMAIWYSPEQLAALDLGDLADRIAPHWQEVMRARTTLLDPSALAAYVKWARGNGRDLAAEGLRRRPARAAAEAAFGRGVQALSAGDPFAAVSAFALASRTLPDEPDYEAYAAWARYLAEAQRGGDRDKAVARERAVAEACLIGRRPRARALFALGSFCLVTADVDAARRHLREAVACDPRMTAARQALARLGG